MVDTPVSLPDKAAPLSITRQLNRWITDAFRRVFDILFSLAMMVFLSPLFLYLVIRIRRDSPGPIFYRGPRLGRNGKVFSIWKFRTMYECPESYDGPPVTAQDDPRITPLGRWLRDTKLNELPQFWNVVKGDMSVVGPRPEDPKIAAEWPAEVRAEILSVRPGVTSPASVIYRDEESLLSAQQVMDTYMDDILPSKLRLDQLYVRHRSFWSDLDIIFWTSLILVPRLGSRQTLEERRLFVGPLSLLMHRHINWLIGDTVVTFVAMGLTGLFWRSLHPLNVGWSVVVPLAIGFAVLFSLSNALLGVNRIDWSQAAANDVFDLLPGAILATIVAMLFNYFYPFSLVAFLYARKIPSWYTRPLLPIGLILMASVLAFAGFVIVRYRSRLITGAATRWVNWRGLGSATQERVLIVGGGETGCLAAWMLSQGRFASAYRVIGFVDDDLYKQDVRIHGVNVLGQRMQIPDLVKRYDVGMIVFAIHNISADERQQVLDICWGTPAKVMMFPDIPAAMTRLERGADPTSLPVNQPASEAIAGTVTFRSPYRYLSRLSLFEMDDRLALLEKAFESGNLESAQLQLHELRAQLRHEIIDLAIAYQKGKET